MTPEMQNALTAGIKREIARNQMEPVGQHTSEKWSEELEAGTGFSWIVGMPGPDLEQGIVLECLGPGRHRIMFRIYGKGPWIEAEKTCQLYPLNSWPGQVREGEPEALRAEFERRIRGQ